MVISDYKIGHIISGAWTSVQKKYIMLVLNVTNDASIEIYFNGRVQKVRSLSTDKLLT
jgi:hypothetical protein